MISTLPHILITNDDGINAPGIKHLWQALNKIAKVTVVAPAFEQSAVGLGITIRSPLRLEKVSHFGASEAWSITGTPADCVKMALSKIMTAPPDLVISGINRGSNAGRNALYSGTVAGSIEAALKGISSIAFSCCSFANPNYETAAHAVPSILKYVLEYALPFGTLLNVNVPPRAFEEIKGFKLARQGQGYWIENPEERFHPTEEHAYYWLGAKIAEFQEHQDSDIALLEEGYITAVPVHVHELTDHQLLKTSKTHFEQLKFKPSS